jgi:hypothetical protein
MSIYFDNGRFHALAGKAPKPPMTAKQTVNSLVNGASSEAPGFAAVFGYADYKEGYTAGYTQSFWSRMRLSGNGLPRHILAQQLKDELLDIKWGE